MLWIATLLALSFADGGAVGTGVVEGVVRDAKGAPLAGARIGLGPHRLSFGRDQLSWPAQTTGPDGAFHFENVPSAIELSLTAMSGERMENSERFVLRESQRLRTEIRFDTRGTINGIVRNPFGDPVPGASVSVLQPWAERQAIIKAGGNGGDMQGGFTHAGADGRFSISGMLPGTYEVSAFTLDTEKTARQTVETGSDVTLIVPRIPRIVGQVVDSQQQPVKIFSVDGQAYDRDLRILMRGEPPEAIEVRAKDLATTVVKVRDLPRDARGDIDLGRIVLSVGRSVKGTVIDAMGSPVAGARVLAMDRPAEEPRMFMCGNEAMSFARIYVPEPMTDAAGRFTMRVASDVKQLFVRSPRHLPAAIPVSDDMKIRLDGGPSIAGHVYSAGGDGYDGLEVIAQGPVYRSGKTDRWGAYVISGLAPGKYRVRVSLDLSRNPRVDFDFSAFQDEDIEIGSRPAQLDFKPRAGKTSLEVLGLPLAPPLELFLVVGSVPQPRDRESLEKLLRKAVRTTSYPHDRFTSLSQGSHTLFVVGRTSRGIRLLTKPVTVSTAERETVTIDFDDAILLP